MADKARVHVLIEGRVQGVFFREPLPGTKPGPGAHRLGP